MPIISIIVPCCNVEKYISQCLESIRSQTFSHFEVICINDGSTDRTAEILKKYAEQDSRFVVINKPNSGYGDSMNLGLDRCCGKYVGIVESDDFIEPDMFKHLYELAERHDLDIARCSYFYYAEGKDVPNVEPKVRKDTVLNPLDHPEVFMQAPSIWASLYRRELIEKNGIRFLPTPGASFQDTGFAFKTYFKARRFLMTDKCLLHYRQHAASSVKSNAKPLCVCDEWTEIIRFARADMSGFEKAWRFIADIRDGSYRWNYNRLNGEAQRRFLMQWSADLRSTKSDGLAPVSPKKRMRCWLIAYMPRVFALYDYLKNVRH